MVKRLLNRWKNISKDFVLNIVASFLITGATQLIVYPILAQRFSSEIYGEILTIMGIVSIIIVALGNTLDNVRLIVNSEYEKENLQGDFNIILVSICVMAVVTTHFVTSLFFNQSSIEVFALCIYVGIMTFTTYTCVEYRLLLNFKRILICNIITAVGYIVGTFLLFLIPLWPIPFVCAMVLQLIYVLLSTELYKEKCCITPLWKKTLLRYAILVSTSLLGNMLTYMDRLLIYPLLGADSVSVYSVAAFFGKSLGIVMIPIAGVLLGYYAQNSFKMSISKFRTINLIAIGCGIVFVIFSIVFSPIITKILYPTLYLQAKPYIFMANFGATISMVCSLTQAAVLKFAPIGLQLLKEGAYCITYILTCLLLLEDYGLWGFCIAAIVANGVKLVILYVIGEKYLEKL